MKNSQNRRTFIQYSGAGIASSFWPTTQAKSATLSTFNRVAAEAVKVKITSVRGYSLRAKLREPFGWPDGSAYHRLGGVIRIDTDSGITGWAPGWIQCAEC